MNRHYFTTIIALFFLLGFSPVFATGGEEEEPQEAQQETTQATFDENLNGRVKSIKILLAGFGDDKTNTVYEFDKYKKLNSKLIYEGSKLAAQETYKFGQLVERQKFHELGHVIEKEVFKYKKDQLVDYRLYNSFNKMVTQEKMKYDRFGNKTEHLINGEPTRFSYHFDKKKNLVEIASYDENDLITQMDVFWYDDDNNRTEWGRYNGEGVNLYKIIYDYDFKGRLVEQSNFDSTGEMNYKKTMIYNPKDMMTEVAEYDGADSLQYRITYSYNNENIISSKIEEFGDGTRTEYEYEQNGNLTELVFFSENDEEQYREDYRYTYDSHDNWVRKAKVCNKQETIIVRSLNYY